MQSSGARFKKVHVPRTGKMMFTKSAVVEGTVTYAKKSEESSLKNGSGVFTSDELSGNYHRNSEGKWNWEWAIYDGKTGVSGDAKLTSSGSSSGDSHGGGMISLRGTTGTYTYNDGFSGSDDTLVEYTYDPYSEEFRANSGSKVTGKTSASADGNYDGAGQPESGSGSVTYYSDWKQSATDTTTLTSAGKYWQRTSNGTGSFSGKTDYKSNSSGSYESKHGLTGQWTLDKKDDSKTDLTWTTAYSGGMQNDSGSGTLKGKSSDVSTRGASGTYASGATSGSYWEDWKSNRSGKADIDLTREKDESWTGNGTASGSSSGNTDWSDKTNLVTTSASYNSTLTTTTDTNTGRHYEYNMSTSRKLSNNTWSAYEGSGTGQGSGWDYLTVTKDGGYTREILVIEGLTSEADYIMPNSLTYTVTGKIEGKLSDKLDYKYDDTFSLSISGWSTATVGDGTRRITDNYLATEEGSMTQSGSDSHHRISHWDPYLGELTYSVSVSLDMRMTRQSKTEIVFDWTNDGHSATEQTKASNRFHHSIQGSLDALLLDVSGNIGSGNGSVEASNYHEAYSLKSDNTQTVDASRTMTAGKNGTAFYESYKTTDESKSHWSTEQTGHWLLHSRVNTTVDGMYVTGKADGIGDSDDRVTSDSMEKSVTTWQWSFDGQSYGTKVNTLVESTSTTSTASSQTDYESTHTTKAWNSSGIISQNTASYSIHELSGTNTSQLTETTGTNTDFEPQFLMGSVQAVMTITAVTGWNPLTSTKFNFNTPELTVSGATSNAGLVRPDLVMATTDFGAYGTVADTRTIWQQLKDTLVQAGDTFINDALQTAVWISGQLDNLTFASGLPEDDSADSTEMTYSGDWLDKSANFFAGWGDTLTFGITNDVRNGLGINDGINQQSSYYKGGELVGNVHLGALAGAGMAAVVARGAVLGAQGLVALGVSESLAVGSVTFTLGVGGVLGALGTVKNSYDAYQAGDWKQLAFNAGFIFGGIGQGNWSARPMANGLNKIKGQPPSSQPLGLNPFKYRLWAKDNAWRGWTSNPFGPNGFGKAMSTGPDVAGAAFTTAFAAPGAVLGPDFIVWLYSIVTD